LIPIRFQRIGDQSILRIHAHISALRQFSFVPGAFDVLLTEAIRFLKPRLQFLLHCQSNLQRDRIDQFQQQVADHAIHLGAGNTLTGRFGVFDPLALTDILRAQARLTHVVAKSHSPTALATDDQALQQCRAFARRALSALQTHRLRTLSQTLEVPFILLPADIGRMRFGQERVPFFPR